MMKQHDFETLMARSLAGILSEDETGRLNEWLQESPDNQARYDRIRSKEAFGGNYSKYANIDTDRAYRAFQERTGTNVVLMQSMFSWLKYAALLLIPLLMIGLYATWHPNKNVTATSLTSVMLPPLEERNKAELLLENGTRLQLKGSREELIATDFDLLALNNVSGLDYAICQINQPTKLHELITPLGASYTVVLSDGTKVHMNAGSRLRYPVSFGTTDRKVYLSGEAYFDVAEDARRPFIIQTDYLNIQEYGTSFNVNTFRPNAIQIVLVEGSIGVTPSGSKKEIRMKPSQLAQYNRASKLLTLSNVDVTRYTAWNKGLFVFEEEPLGEMMSTLSRWYDVRVRFLAPGVSSMTFTGHLSRESTLEEIMNTIQFSTDVQYEIRDKEVVIGSLSRI